MDLGEGRATQQGGEAGQTEVSPQSLALRGHGLGVSDKLRVYLGPQVKNDKVAWGDSRDLLW